MDKFLLPARIFIAFFLLCLLTLMASITFAQTTADPASLVTQIVAYFSSGSYALGASAVIMLLTYLLGTTLLQKWIPSAALPWISIGLGVIAAVVSSIAGGMVWWKAIINGFFMGNAASGLWSALGKYLLPAAKPTEIAANAAVVKAEVIVAKMQAVKPEFTPKVPNWVSKQE